MSNEQGLSHAVRAFIREHIRSVSDLELLALVSSAPETLWTAAAVDRKLRSNEHSVARRLAEFARAGLLVQPEEAVAAYRYQPREAELGAVAAQVIREYRSRPVLVIATMFNPAGDAAQTFADAFRLRPK